MPLHVCVCVCLYICMFVIRCVITKHKHNAVCGSQPRREGDLVSSSWIIELFIRDLDKRALMPKQHIQRQKGLVRCNLKWNKIKALTADGYCCAEWGRSNITQRTRSRMRGRFRESFCPELNLLYNWMMLYTIWNIIHARLAKHTSASFLLSRRAYTYRCKTLNVTNNIILYAGPLRSARSVG